MNGVISQVRKTFKSLFREDKITFISFIILPLVMAAIYGTMQAKSFDGKNNDMTAIKTQFVYNEQSDKGKILTSVLKESQVKNFIDTTSKDADCEVTISENFDDIKVKSIHCSDAKMSIVTSFVRSFSHNLNQYQVISNIASLQISGQEKEKLIKNMVEELQSIQKGPAVEEKIISGYKTLGSYEYYGIATFSFTSIILILILVNKFFADKNQGIVKRSFATPISKSKYLLGYAISSTLTAFLINLTYVIICRAAGISFKGNLLGMFLVAFVQSLLQGAMATTVIAFIKNKNIVNSVLGIFIVLPAIIGGVFYNGEIIEGNFFKTLNALSPNTLVLNAYKTISITNSISNAMGYIVCMIVIALVLITVSTIKVKVKWED